MQILPYNLMVLLQLKLILPQLCLVSRMLATLIKLPQGTRIQHGSRSPICAISAKEVIICADCVVTIMADVEDVGRPEQAITISGI